MPLRHARVGLGDQRRAGARFAHRENSGEKIRGADAAIRAVGDRRGIEGFDQSAEGGGRDAHHRAPGGVEARADRVRHSAFRGGQRRRADFLGRRHGLDPCDIGAAFLQALDLLDEHLDRLVFSEGSQRGEEVAGRSDGSGDDDRPAGGVRDLARVTGGQTVELAGAVLEPVQHEAAAIAAETVGQDDVGAGVDEGPMQALGPVGMDRVPKLRIVAGGEPHGEEVGAGRAVREQRPTFGQKGLQHVGSLGVEAAQRPA